jgi:hypothetical protein
MTFKPDPSTPYQPINDDINAQTFVAKAVSPSQALGFTVSGAGSLPRDTQTTRQSGGGGAAGDATAAQDNRPGIGLGNPIDTPDPLNKYKWWILSGVGLVLVIAAALFLRRPAREQEDTRVRPPAHEPQSAQHAAKSNAAYSAPVQPPSPPVAEADPEQQRQAVLNSLKEELFALETDRARGTVGEVEYAAHKQALEAVIRRALSR